MRRWWRRSLTSSTVAVSGSVARLQEPKSPYALPSRHPSRGETCRRTERPLLIEQRVVEVAVQRMNGSAESQDRDLLAVEEPLESHLGYGTAEGRRSRSITVTMRTPGSAIGAPGLPPRRCQLICTDAIPEQRRSRLSASSSQAARAGTVISRQSWNRFFISCR